MPTQRYGLAPLDTPKITPSESEVLKLAHANKSNMEISAALRLRLVTVKSYLYSAKVKHRDHLNRMALGKLEFPPQANMPRRTSR